MNYLDTLIQTGLNTAPVHFPPLKCKTCRSPCPGFEIRPRVSQFHRRLSNFAGGETEGGPEEEGRRRPGARQTRPSAGANPGQVHLVRDAVVHALFLTGRRRRRRRLQRLRQTGQAEPRRRVLAPAGNAERVRVLRLVAAQPGVRVRLVKIAKNAHEKRERR